MDVAIVIDRLTSKEAREIADITGDLLTRFDVLVSPFALSAQRFAELQARERLIAREISDEGIPL